MNKIQSNELPRVVILGKNDTIMLGMIRAVGSCGFDVYVIRTFTKKNFKNILFDIKIERFSKYIKNYFCVSNENEMINTLLNECKAHHQKVVLIPLDDQTASAIDSNSSILQEFFDFPYVYNEDGSVVQNMDKYLQKRVAEQSGLKVAKGFSIDLIDGKYNVPADIPFPCFVKPEISILGNKNDFMRKCETYDELKKLLLDISNKFSCCPVLIEEYVNIEHEYGILGFSNRNNVFLPYLIEKIETGKGAHAGVTMKGCLKPLDQNSILVKNLTSMIKTLGFVGLFDIDLYENNGNIYFNELNLRSGAAGFSVFAAGINLPELYINSFMPYVENVADKINYYKEHLKNNNQPLLFINEKVALLDFEDGHSSWADYKNKQSNVDIYFIKNDDDPKPYNAFKKKEIVSSIKHIYKSLLKNNKIK